MDRIGFDNFQRKNYFDLQFRNACGRFETAFSQEGSQRETAFAVPVSCGNIRTAGLLLGSQQVKEKAPANAEFPKIKKAPATLPSVRWHPEAFAGAFSLTC